MNKTTKWYAKPLYAVMALALVAGLMMVPGTSPIVEATVEDVTVTNDPTTTNTSANYTINFSTLTGLTYNSDYINITFPDDTTVPDGGANYNGNVTVNGHTCDGTDGNVTGNVTTRLVNITVPRDIPAGSVSVVIAKAAGVRNPTTVATNWTLNVSTSKETTPVPSANYSTAPPVPPEITEVAGTAYQSGNDVVSITFSEGVQPVGGGTWNASSNFTSIYCGTTNLTLTNAVCTIDSANTSLTITLNETADGDYLVIGQTLNVTPAYHNITDMTGTTYVPNTTKSGNIRGDSVAPTVALTYNRTFPVKENDILNITATFSEAMQANATIAINTTGNNTPATDMTEINSTVWNYTYNVPADSNGTATVTIAGKDLAGNNVTQAATNNTFTIDNIIPTIGVTDIIGTTIKGAGDTINITFSEAVNATGGTWNKTTFVFIQSPNGTNLTLDNAVFTPSNANKTLTITLNETSDSDYLVNDDTVTVKPATGNITDVALNPVANATVIGTTAITGDVDAPTITNIVGVDSTTINITFSESVVAAGGEWNNTAFTSIESPDGAPLNINHATFTPNNVTLTNAATVLTVSLNITIDGASWVTGNVICVTPAANKTVDLAGNKLAPTEVSSADATAPTISSIVGTTIQDAGDTIVITFSEAVTPAEATPVWSANELGIESPDASGLTLTTAGFVIDGTDTVLTITLDEAIDGAYLVNGNKVFVTPKDSAIKDADGNFADHTTEVPSADVVDGDIVPPTITSIVGWDGAGNDTVDRDIIRIDFSEAVVPNGSWSAETQLNITNANLTGATFVPASGITTTLTITLNATLQELTPGDTLTVTPVESKVLDLAGNEMSVESTCSGVVSDAGYAIDLASGWNLISLPLVPTSSNITVVLSDLIADGTVSQARTWVWEGGVLVPRAWQPPEIQEFTTMVDGQGYWIEMDTADTLVVTGTELPAPPLMPHSYNVYTGWNMIGFKSLTGKNATAYLGSAVIGKMEGMYGYNATAGVYTIIQATAPDLVPGDGYWLAVNANGTIYP